MSRSTEAVAPDHPYVSRREGVCGGRAAVTGTRIAGWVVARRYRAGGMIEEMLEEWPHLGAAQLFDALSYLSDHAAAIDLDIEANRSAGRGVVRTASAAEAAAVAAAAAPRGFAGGPIRTGRP